MSMRSGACIGAYMSDGADTSPCAIVCMCMSASRASTAMLLRQYVCCKVRGAHDSLQCSSSQEQAVVRGFKLSKSHASLCLSTCVGICAPAEMHRVAAGSAGPPTAAAFAAAAAAAPSGIRWWAHARLRIQANIIGCSRNEVGKAQHCCGCAHESKHRCVNVPH